MVPGDTPAPRMTTEEAIRHLRRDPEYEDLIRWSYLGEDTAEAAGQFEASAEFSEVVNLVGGFEGKYVVDLGAGTGIASVAIAHAGAERVHALEPDPSDVIGRGAIARITRGEPIEILDGIGESIPLPDRSVDVVYARQMLHHAPDPDPIGREAARVLRLGGIFLACREHVVDDDEELRTFLAEHPVNRLAGGEGAHSLSRYEKAMSQDGLRLRRVWGTYDSILNAFPAVHSNQELVEFRQRVLGRWLAGMGKLAGRLPGTAALVRRRLAPYTSAGRMYSFMSERR
jgi:SAM-dependent methyltransferase